MKPSARTRLLKTFIRLLGPVLLAVIILRVPHPKELLRAVVSANPGLLALALLLNVANIYLKVVRWDVILRVRGIRYPTGRALAAFMTSLYVGLLTPGRVGDVLRAQYLKHDLDVPYAEGIASVVVDRLCDLYVLVAFVAVGVLRYASVLAGGLGTVMWVGVAGIVFGPLLFLVPGVAERLFRRVFTRFSSDESGLVRFLEAVRANAGKPLLVTIPLTVATFAINYLQGYWIAHAMGLPMTAFDATCLLAIASLLGLLPVSISGVGVREMFFSLAFPMLGFSPADGIVFGLLVFFVIYLAIVGIGFVAYVAFPPPASVSPKQEEAV